MRDIFDKCKEFVSGPNGVRGEDREFAAELFSSVSPPGNAGPWMQLDGRRMLQFSTNDYLGLAMHPEVRARAVRIVQEYGVCSPMGSRLLTGNTEYHLLLEQEVAALKRCESALTFPAGAMATTGTLACLADSQDLLIMDEHAHATLICGAKASGVKILFFRHNHLEHLENILSKSADSRPLAIVVDGVYSMQGDLAPLAELVPLKKKYGARLIVDDAHGTGVCGENGRGTAAHFGVEDEVDLHLGTFSKAVGTIGGFVAGNRAVVEYIRYNAPTFVFTKAMPLAVAEATRLALELLDKADAQRKRLWENTRRLQGGLKARGFSIGNTQSPITPIQVDGTDALYIARELRQAYRIWVSPVIYPAVHLGKSLLRIIPTAMHTDADIDYLIDSITETRGSMILGSIRVI